jgi:hypothetical protein
MAQVTDEKIRDVTKKLWREVYEHPFRGKKRGRFAITRDQMRLALGVKKLHGSTIQRVQDEALDLGLIIVDLDDLFPCIEIKVVRKYRRPSKAVFEEIFEISIDEDDDEATNDEEESVALDEE